MRAKPIIGFLLAGNLVLLLALDHGPRQVKPPPPSEAEVRLSQPAPAIHWQNVPLEKVVDLLHAGTGCDFSIAWDGISDSSEIYGRANRKSPVTLILSPDVSWKQVMQLALDYAAGGQQRLGYRTAGNTVTIAVENTLQQRSITARTYDLRPFLRWHVANEIRLAQEQQKGDAEYYAQTGSVPGDVVDDTPPPPVDPEQVEQQETASLFQILLALTLSEDGGEWGGQFLIAAGPNEHACFDDVVRQLKALMARELRENQERTKTK